MGEFEKLLLRRGGPGGEAPGAASPWAEFMAQEPAGHEPRPDPGAADPATSSAPRLWNARIRMDPMVGALEPGLLGKADDSYPTGVERRLARRAERLWSELGDGGACLPPASAAAALLAPPFSTQALLVLQRRDGEIRIGHTGSDLARLGVAGPGVVLQTRSVADLTKPESAAAAASLPVADRLVALALGAMAVGRPRHLDCDYDPDHGADGPSPDAGLLFRAVALPLEPGADKQLTGMAVVVVSWRKLLSARETEELHRELQAAMAWLGKGRA